MIRRITGIFLFACYLSGCSVFMAATGSDPIDLSAIRIGADRSDIERQLGKPINFFRRGNGDYAVYQVLTNDKADYGRAATYAVLVGLTLGLAEFATFPTEALQGDQNKFEVIYSPAGKAVSIKHFKTDAPMPNPTEVFDQNISRLQQEI